MDRVLSSEEQDLLARYLAAQMTPEEQRTFEQRILDDPPLSEALYAQSALEPHVPARGAAPARVIALPQRRTWAYVLPIAAALIAALVLTLPGRLGRHAPADQMRGAEAVPHLREPVGPVDRVPTRFTWSAAAGAASYSLQVVGADSAPLYQTSTTDTTVELPGGALPATLGAARWRVVPYDGSGLELPIPPYAEFRVVPR